VTCAQLLHVLAGPPVGGDPPRVLPLFRVLAPDSEVLASPEMFKPYYDEGTDLARDSWSGNSWQQGGAPVWGPA